MSAAPRTPLAAVAPIADLEQARFDRALVELQLDDPRTRVALDDTTGLAIGIDTTVRVAMPAAARALSETDRAAAASVLFLDRYGALLGIPGWHALEPRVASPLGRTTWFTFAAATSRGGELMVSVCAEDDTVRHVRVARD